MFSAFFFGLVSFGLTALVGKSYGYLFALPGAIVFSLIFFLNRMLFLLLVVVFRASLDVVFESIKIGSFGLGGVLNALVIIIALTMYLQRKDSQNLKISSISKAWLIFIAVNFISILYTPVLLTGIKAFLSYLSYAAMFFIGFYLIKSNTDFSKWVKVMALSSLIPAIYGIKCLTLGGNGFYYSLEEGMRLQSTFPHPNPFAPYLVLMIGICFFIYKSSLVHISDTLRKWLPVYIFILIGMLVMTKTRSAWAACYIFFLMYGVVIEKRFLIIVLIAPFLALLIPDIQDRIMDATRNSDYGATGYGRLNSFAWRVKIWHDSIDWMAPTRYLLGYGVHAFVHHSLDFGMANAYQKATFEINAHNIYVQTFFNLGLIGLLSFLYLLFTNCKLLFTHFIKHKLLVFCTLAFFLQYMLQGYSDNTWDYLIFEWYFWLFTGLTIGFLELNKNVMNEENHAKR